MYRRYVGCLRCWPALQCISFSSLQVPWFHQGFLFCVLECIHFCTASFAGWCLIQIQFHELSIFSCLGCADLLIDFKRYYIRSLKLTLTHYLRRYNELTFVPQFHSFLHYLALKMKSNTRNSSEFIILVDQQYWKGNLKPSGFFTYHQV